MLLSLMSHDEHLSARWATPFGNFVRKFGVSQLAQELQVEPAAIYQWIRGHTSPRPPKARAIVMLSRNHVCVVRLDDIYAQRDLHVD